MDLIIRVHNQHIISLTIRSANEKGHVTENPMSVFLASIITHKCDFFCTHMITLARQP